MYKSGLIFPAGENNQKASIYTLESLNSTIVITIQWILQILFINTDFLVIIY